MSQWRNSIPARLPAPAPVSDRSQMAAQQRAFVVGSAAVETADQVWGRDPSVYAPEEYGHYPALSTAVYRANEIRASNLGRLPVHLWRQKRDGDLEPVTRGDLYGLLDRVNPHWTMGKLIRFTEWSRGLWGSAYWVINRGRNGTGAPREIWWVRPDRMRVVPHPDLYIAGYIYEHNGTQIPFAPSEVIWLPLDNPFDEFSGLSPLASARLSVDTARQGMLSNRRIFSNGLMAAALVSPQKPEQTWSEKDIKLLTEYFGRLAVGVDNSHAAVIMNQMAQVSRLALAPEEMQYLDQLKWSLAEVARAYGVPVSLLQDNTYSTYNNREQDEKALWSDTLIPEAEAIAEALTEYLLPMFPGERVSKITLDYSDVSALQPDRSAVSLVAQRWWRMGVPLNTVLQEYAPQLLPESGAFDWGDEPMPEILLALAQVEALESGKSTPDTPSASMSSNADDAEQEIDTDEDADDPARSIRQALSLVQGMQRRQSRFAYGSDAHVLAVQRFNLRADRAERDITSTVRDLFARQRESVLARLHQRGRIWTARTPDDSVAAPFDVEEWTDRFEDALLPVFTAAVASAGAETMLDLGLTGTFDVTNPIVTDWIQSEVQTMVSGINETTWAQLRDILQAAIDQGLDVDDIARQINDVFEQDIGNRAQVIARTESTRATNGGSLQAARLSGVVLQKEWLATLDNRVRESHRSAHGQRVGLEDDFTVGDARGQHPGGMDRAEESVQCRCTLLFLTDADD